MTVLDPQVSRKDALRGERGGSLTPRELQILQHIVAGKSNKEIATSLSLSPYTVETHRRNLQEKLNLHSFAELILYAVRKGIIC